MSAQIDEQIKGILVLLAQTDARIAAIQSALEYVFNEDEKTSFERHYASLYRICLRRKIESIEDVHSPLAIELQRVLNRMPKGE